MLTDKNQLYSRPEIWGGIECTINRVKNIYYDQLIYSGHYKRDNDLDALAGLGITKLRYPLLWEFHEPKYGKSIDWSWSERQLSKIRSLNIDPIVTLVHHGSGPRFTNLLDDKFPELLADYASKVAQQFPWIKYYTPVNEPLTTARFSGLYGFWYPHKNNDVSFIKMLLNELKGIVLSMRAIRKINPDAQLIQTEDLGKTYSKPSLEYQAIFENHRRWLTYDLLTGNFPPEHPMRQYLNRLGIEDENIEFFINNPCPPDIMGMNYYVTSERYLDDEIEKYDKHTHGSNDLQIYADIEAVRVPHDHPMGLKLLLTEAWNRYHLPLAITEAHINCHREEQMRWFLNVWQDCFDLCKSGILVNGVTAWSLFGAHGWNKLLLTEEKDYETGVFDVRSGKVRKTALFSVLKSLSRDYKFEHPVTEIPGWWKRNIRFLNTFGIADKSLEELMHDKIPSPVLIIGKTGTLGKAFASACTLRKIHYILLGRKDLDITNAHQIEVILERYKPWALINAAGYVRVDDAENDKEKCFNENAFAVEKLAKSCKEKGVKFLSFSSDLVFDGYSLMPYDEDSSVSPVNVYGSSKALAEELAFKNNPDTLMIRTSTFFSPFDSYNFVHSIIGSLTSGRVFTAAKDIVISPTYVPDLVNASLDLLIDNETGIWHLSCGQELSWATLAKKIADATGISTDHLKFCNAEEINFIARRPKYSVLGTKKGIVLPSFEDGLARYLHEDTKQLKISLKNTK